MSQKIKQLTEKIKTKTKQLNRDDFFLIAVIVLISITAFGLGRISAIRDYKTPIEIQEFPFPYKLENSEGLVNPVRGREGSQRPSASNGVKASINGTKYYYPWCSGLNRIKPENIIEFISPQEAELAGYELASNCSPR